MSEANYRLTPASIVNESELVFLLVTLFVGAA